MKTPETLTAVPSAPNKRNHTTVKQRRETSDDERPLYWPLRWRGKKKQAGFCFVDALINTMLMLSGALFGVMVAGSSL